MHHNTTTSTKITMPPTTAPIMTPRGLEEVWVAGLVICEGELEGKVVIGDEDVFEDVCGVSNGESEGDGDGEGEGEGE